jgi:hypothetical protein
MANTNSAGYKMEKRICPNPQCRKEFDCPRTKPATATCSRECGYQMRELRVKGAEPLTQDQIEQQILDALKARRNSTLEDLSNILDRGMKVTVAAVESLKKKGYNIALSETKRGSIQLEAIAFTRPRSIVQDLKDYEGKWYKFGVCGDKHLCNQHSRIDVLNLLYDLYEAEGITTVYDTGNWIDGEARFNKSELLVHGLDAQIDYLIQNHPAKKGLKTFAVAGDDHEGWYQQRECLDIGKYAEMKMRSAGREDWVHLGYAESIIELKASKGSRMMMVNHPGGGSSYAISYKGQKYVEGLTGGEKPAIVLQGHYHKFNVGYPREVFVVDSGTCCDQTLFMRKRQLQAHVGGLIIELMQAPDGRIVRFRVEFLPFYDRGFYEKQRRHFGLPKNVPPKAA